MGHTRWAYPPSVTNHATSYPATNGTSHERIVNVEAQVGHGDAPGAGGRDWAGEDCARRVGWREGMRVARPGVAHLVTALLKVGEAGRVVASICKLFVPLKTKEIWAWLNNPPTSNQPFCAM